MPNIDTLSIQFSTNGTKTAINNITAMGVAVKGLASNINSIDAGKIDALANSLKQLRGSAPTKDQTARIVGFGNAISGVAKLFDGVDNGKIQGFANALDTIKSAVPTKNQNENISGFGMALGGMGNALNSVDGSKLNVFVSGMEQIKSSIPTSNQVTRISDFAVAVKDLTAAIGSANISEFSKDMSVLGGAVEQFKKSSVNSITNAVTAMKNMGQTAVQTANQVANATPEKSGDVKMNDNRDVLRQSQELIASLDQVKVKASGIAGIMQKLGLATPTKQFRNLEAQAEKVRAKYEELRASMQKALNSGDIKADSPEYKKKMAQLDALRNSYNELILKQRELAQEGGAVQFSPYLTQSLDAFKTGATKAVSLLKRGLVSGFKIATTHIKSFASKVKQAGSALKNTVFNGNSATSMAKKFANEIFRVSKMLKLMVTRMALRKVIAEVGNGFKSLAIHSDEFNDNVSGIMNASKQLGYSFSAMVSPLINALAPALIYIINIFTKLVNIINQVFSALTGKTSWNKAKEFTDSWRDSFDDTTESAKKTTKELKKTVLGFDELNQLQDNTDKSASTTKSNPIEDMFETVKIDKKWKDLAKWLKDMWKIGDFTELGTKLGKKLKKMLESIPWEEIRKTSNKLGRALASLINGFVEVEGLGNEIGKTIAQSVNTVFEFLNGFVHKLHWDSIGKFIADTFNGFFENIDWKLIKDTVVTGMKGLGKAFQSFIENFHWDNISTFIINAIDTITSGIKAFINEIDWLDLGVKIGEQLNKIMEGVDWKDVGETLGSVLESAIDWAYGLVTTFSVDDAVTALSDFLDGVCEKVDSYKAGETLGLALHKLIDVIVKFWQNEENRAKIKEEVIGFFQGIFDNLTTQDFDFIATSAGAIALLSALGNILKTNAMEITLTIAVAYAGARLGGYIGKIMTGDPVYDEYPIDVVIKWTVENLPTTWDEFVERIKEIKDAWHQICTEAHWFVKIIAFIANPSGFIMEWAKEILGESPIGTEGGSGAPIDADEWKATYEAAAEQTEKVRAKTVELTEAEKEHQQKLKELWAEYGEGILSYDEYHRKVEELDNAYKNVNASADEVKGKTKTIWAEGEPVLKNYRESVAKLSDKQKEIMGIYSDTTSKLSENKTQVDNNIKSNDKLNQVLEDGQKAYKNVKSAMDEPIKNTPYFTKTQKEVIDALGGVGKETENLASTAKTSFGDYYNDSKVVWEDVPIEMADAQLEISGIEKTLAQDTSDSMNDIKKSVDESMRDVNNSFDSIKKGMDKESWTFPGIADGLRESFDAAIDGVKGIWNKFADTINGDYEIGSVKIPIHLPTFYRGGFPEDGLFMANHNELVGSFSNGRTAVANNDQIIQGISAGVYNAVSRANSDSSGAKYIANTIVVDGEVIARSVTKAQERQNMRYSPTLA